MPIFEYQCHTCKAVSDFLVGVTREKKAIVCPNCGGKKLTKLVSASNVGRSGAGDFKMPESPCANGSCDPGACPGGVCPMG